MHVSSLLNTNGLQHMPKCYYDMASFCLLPQKCLKGYNITQKLEQSIGHSQANRNTILTLLWFTAHFHF